MATLSSLLAEILIDSVIILHYPKSKNFRIIGDPVLTS